MYDAATAPNLAPAHANLECAHHALGHKLPVSLQLARVQFVVLVLVHLRHKAQLEGVKHQLQVQVIRRRHEQKVADRQRVRGGSKDGQQDCGANTAQQGRPLRSVLKLFKFVQVLIVFHSPGFDLPGLKSAV